MANYNKYPRGSEWRKWDLQVQPIKGEWLPNIEGGGYDEALTRRIKEFLNKSEQENIEVLGITDHNCGYAIDKLISMSKNIIIMPGVELDCIEGWHLLVIFNPEYKSKLQKNTWSDTINFFLSNICKIESPYFEGDIAKKIRINTEELLSALYLEKIGMPIFAHCTSNDGFFQRSDAGTRKILLNQFMKGESQFIFEIKNDFSQIQSITQKIKNYTGVEIPVPIISGSDSHELTTIGSTYTWLKSDPTFKGLTQILFEPARIYLGEDPPLKTEKNKIIKSIKVKNCKNWFPSEVIEFNEGQVSVIGGKGSGKTAILDLIAYATKSLDVEEGNSFLKRAHKELIGTKIEVTWGSNEKDEIEIRNKIDLPLPLQKRKVKYLTQSYVEQLCDYKNLDNLTRQIEDIIFQNLPVSQKSEYLDFQSYKLDKLKILRKQQDRNRHLIENLNQDIFDKYSKVHSEEELNKQKIKIKNDLSNLKKEYKKLKKKETIVEKQKFDSLEKLNSQRSKKETDLSNYNKRILLKDEIIDDLQTFQSDANLFIEELKKKLENLGVEALTINKVRFSLEPKNLDLLLNQYIIKLQTKIKNETKSLKEINQKIVNITRELKLEESRKEKLDEINKKVSEYSKKLENINKESLKIMEYKNDISKLNVRRKDIYKEWFYNLTLEYNALMEMYAPITISLDKSIETESRLFDFYVKFDFDVELMTENGDELIDHGKKGRYYQKTKAALAEELKQMKIDITFNKYKNKDEFLNQNDEKIQSYLQAVEKLFNNSSEQVNIDEQLKKNKTSNDFYNWLYSFDYYKLNYSIKFNKIDLEKLSPGLKGIALLILFLELDKEDYTPLLVDQPEENLDNRSVYETLRKYFINAKKRRQIFLVTHNPNLVVNTDSEQILVANFDPSLSMQSTNIHYVSGSLEHDKKYDNNEKILLNQRGIKQHICHVLEGGEKAFKERERKYAIKEYVD